MFRNMYVTSSCTAVEGNSTNSFLFALEKLRHDPSSLSSTLTTRYLYSLLPIESHRVSQDKPCQGSAFKLSSLRAPSHSS